jgi:glycosyltransferase involved in cell wall biosynthesis
VLKVISGTGDTVESVSLDGEKSARPTVLFVTPILQHPAAGGPYLRIENSIKALRRVSDLHICSRTSLKAMGGKSALTYYRGLSNDFVFAPSSGIRGRYFNALRRRANVVTERLIGRAILADEYTERSDHAAVVAMARAIDADVIWLGYGNISYPLLRYIKENSDFPVVLDTDSVWSRFVLRGLPYAADAAERDRIAAEGKDKEREETWGTQIADITTAVSDIDAEYYRALAKHERQVRIFANVIDLDSYKVAPRPVEGFRTPALHLAGTFGPHSPMDDAARWVIDEVMPRIRERRTDAHLYIVGRGSKETLSDIRSDDVTVTGELASVLPYLCNASVALVPLRYESGTRFKILEAGACGIPVVSTTLGAEGIPARNGVDLWLADDPDSFANAVLRVLDDPGTAAGVANNLRRLVRQDYAIDTLATQASDILSALVQV